MLFFIEVGFAAWFGVFVLPKILSWLFCWIVRYFVLWTEPDPAKRAAFRASWLPSWR